MNWIGECENIFNDTERYKVFLDYLLSNTRINGDNFQPNEEFLKETGFPCEATLATYFLVGASANSVSSKMNNLLDKFKKWEMKE